MRKKMIALMGISIISLSLIGYLIMFNMNGTKEIVNDNYYIENEVEKCELNVNEKIGGDIDGYGYYLTCHKAENISLVSKKTKEKYTLTYGLNNSLVTIEELLKTSIQINREEIQKEESFKYEEVKFLMNDQKDENESFSLFMDQLIVELKAYNVDFILEHTSEQIATLITSRWSVEEFKEELDVEKHPELTEMLEQVIATINLGFTYDSEKEIFISPDLYSNFPEGFSKYDYYVCSGTNVIARKEPVEESEEIMRVDNLILYVAKEEGDWTNIILPNGTKAYVESKNLVSPLDYKVKFIYENDKWIFDLLLSY